MGRCRWVACRGDGGVEALEMARPGREHRPFAARDRRHRVGLSESGRQRLLNKAVNASFKERGGDFAAWCAVGTQTEAAVGVTNGAPKRPELRKRRRNSEVFARPGRAVVGSGIDNCEQMDGVAGLFELAVDTQVVASEDAGTGDEDVGWG